ncbi:hypothetical protein, partial [Rhizobium leguminosarum]|uniref:hypothetical protein n=1 Tax=Rhizobium leguminosarum TaxID=384 RepID=UPI003F9AC019
DDEGIANPALRQLGRQRFQSPRLFGLGMFDDAVQFLLCATRSAAAMTVPSQSVALSGLSARDGLTTIDWHDRRTLLRTLNPV